MKHTSSCIKPLPRLTICTIFGRRAFQTAIYLELLLGKAMIETYLVASVSEFPLTYRDGLIDEVSVECGEERGEESHSPLLFYYTASVTSHIPSPPAHHPISTRSFRLSKFT
jgi:hypothetical protein